MRMNFRRIAARILTACQVAAAAPALAEPTPSWQVSFGGIGRPSIGMYERPQLVRNAADDGAYIHDFSRSPYAPLPVAAPVDASGHSAWSVTASPAMSGWPQQLVALSDRSIVTAHNEVVRYAADGRILWSLPLPRGMRAVPHVVEVGNDLVLLNASTRVPAWRVDRDTGRVIEQVEDSPELSPASRLVAAGVGADTVYVATVSDDPDGIKLAKLKLAPLRFEWIVQLALPDSARATSIAADATGVYVAHSAAIDSALAKFSPVDGAPLWSVAGAYGDQAQVVRDIDGDPVVGGGRVVEKLNQATGARRWIHATPGEIAGLDVTAGAIVIAGTAPDAWAEPSPVPGFVERLSRGDGTTQWSIPLAVPSGAETSAARSVAVLGDRVLVAGVACDANAKPERCHLVYWLRGLDGTGNEATTPLFDLSSTGLATRASDDTTVGAALEDGPQGLQIRVKRVRNADGVVLWDSVRPAWLPYMPGAVSARIEVQVGDANDDTIAVLYGRSGGQGISHTSDYALLVLDGETGAYRWQRSLLEMDGGHTDIGVNFFGIDTIGNVFAGVHEGGGAETESPFSRRQVRKYAAGSGATLLRIPYPQVNSSVGGLPYSPVIRVVDNDVLSEGNPMLPNDAALTRVSGSTGAAIWTNASIPFPYYSSIGATTYIAASFQSIDVNAIDLVDGSVLWTSSYADPSDDYYSVFESLVGSDGNVYVGGIRRIPRPGVPSSWEQRGILARFDGQGGATAWVNRFDPNPVATSNPSVLPKIEHGGVLFSLQKQTRSTGDSLNVLTGVSMGDGTLLGTQVLDQRPGLQPRPVASLSGIDTMGSAADGDVVASAYIIDVTQRARFALAKFPAPEVHAGSSLKVSLSTSVVPQGSASLVAFLFETINDGSLPASEVEARLAIPPYAILEEVACSIDGTPCETVLTPAALGLRQDLASGASIRIGGTLRLQMTEVLPTLLEASAFAPYGFVEMDMKDNIRSVRLDTVLFRHGFD